LLREAKGLTGRILASYRIDELRKEVATRLEPREKLPTSVEIPFGPDTKNVLQFAVQEADRLLHREIGTEHLLLGLIREERSVAGTHLDRSWWCYVRSGAGGFVVVWYWE
jgi:ATP-dependent Clp protease ATP-binding subunit ClpC